MQKHFGVIPVQMSSRLLLEPDGRMPRSVRIFRIKIFLMKIHFTITRMLLLLLNKLLLFLLIPSYSMKCIARNYCRCCRRRRRNLLSFKT